MTGPKTNNKTLKGFIRTTTLCSTMKEYGSDDSCNATVSFSVRAKKGTSKKFTADSRNRVSPRTQTGSKTCSSIRESIVNTHDLVFGKAAIQNDLYCMQKRRVFNKLNTQTFGRSGDSSSAHTVIESLREERANERPFHQNKFANQPCRRRQTTMSSDTVRDNFNRPEEEWTNERHFHENKCAKQTCSRRRMSMRPGAVVDNFNRPEEERTNERLFHANKCANQPCSGRRMSMRSGVVDKNFNRYENPNSCTSRNKAGGSSKLRKDSAAGRVIEKFEIDHESMKKLSMQRDALRQQSNLQQKQISATNLFIFQALPQISRCDNSRSRKKSRRLSHRNSLGSKSGSLTRNSSISTLSSIESMTHASGQDSVLPRESTVRTHSQGSSSTSRNKKVDRNFTSSALLSIRRQPRNVSNINIVPHADRNNGGPSEPFTRFDAINHVKNPRLNLNHTSAPQSLFVPEGSHSAQENTMPRKRVSFGHLPSVKMNKGVSGEELYRRDDIDSFFQQSQRRGSGERKLWDRLTRGINADLASRTTLENDQYREASSKIVSDLNLPRNSRGMPGRKSSATSITSKSSCRSSIRSYTSNHHRKIGGSLCSMPLSVDSDSLQNWHASDPCSRCQVGDPALATEKRSGVHIQSILRPSKRGSATLPISEKSANEQRSILGPILRPSKRSSVTLPVSENSTNEQRYILKPSKRGSESPTNGPPKSSSLYHDRGMTSVDLSVVTESLKKETITAQKTEQGYKIDAQKQRAGEIQPNPQASALLNGLHTLKQSLKKHGNHEPGPHSLAELDDWLEHCRDSVALSRRAALRVERRDICNPVCQDPKHAYNPYEDEDFMREIELSQNFAYPEIFKPETVPTNLSFLSMASFRLESMARELNIFSNKRGKPAYISYPRDILQIVRLLPGNNLCADCSTSEASGLEWASVKYGILLCKPCASKHIMRAKERKYRDIIVVKAILDDSWGINDILQILEGGNGKFNKYLMQNLHQANAHILPFRKSRDSEDYKISKTFDARYGSKAASCYRKEISESVSKVLGKCYCV